jgi:NTE family protein
MVGFDPPQVLVLGGGGILGEAWMTAVLAGLEETSSFDPRACEGFVGTSAGAIVATALSAGVDPRARLGELPEQPSVAAAAVARDRGLPARVLELTFATGRGAGAPLALFGLRATETGGALLRKAALRRVPAGRRSLDGLGRELERAGAHWDGRLSLAAVDLESGRRVMFGAPDAPEASIAAAVEASCAIPGVFRPVVVAGRSYVDGGVWSPTNMDRAPVGRGTRVLCLNPTGSSVQSNLATPLGAFGLLSRSIAGVEAMALERQGAHVTIISPDKTSIAAIGTNLMNPRRRSRVIAAGMSQGRACQSMVTGSRRKSSSSRSGPT